MFWLLGLAGLGKSPWFILPSMVSLVASAWLLTLVEGDAVGEGAMPPRAVYIAAALVWLWQVEDVRSDRWDLLGTVLCLGGATIILFGRR